MKRNFGKLITILLCLTMLLSLFPVTALVAEGEVQTEDKAIVIPGVDKDDIGDIIGGIGSLPEVIATPTPDALSGSCGESASWKLDFASDTLIISGTGAISDYGTSDSPWYAHRSKIKSLVVEDGITEIGDNAFRGCQNIITASLPESLTAIGNYAFYECRLMEQVNLPESITALG